VDSPIHCCCSQVHINAGYKRKKKEMPNSFHCSMKIKHKRLRKTHLKLCRKPYREVGILKLSSQSGAPLLRHDSFEARSHAHIMYTSLIVFSRKLYFQWAKGKGYVVPSSSRYDKVAVRVWAHEICTFLSHWCFAFMAERSAYFRCYFSFSQWFVLESQWTASEILISICRKRRISPCA